MLAVNNMLTIGHERQIYRASGVRRIFLVNITAISLCKKGTGLMAQIILNSALAILVAAAFLTTTAAALRGDDRAAQRVPVKARNERHPR